MNVRDRGVAAIGVSGARVRPHWLPRLGMLIPAGVVSTASIMVAVEKPILESLTLAVVVTVGCLFTAARWVLFAGFRRRGDGVIVTGLLWSRRIPLRQIDRVTTGFASIHWRSRAGIRWITPVTALWSEPNSLPDVTRYNDRRLSVLRRWVREVQASGEPRRMDRV